ncbi:MAG: hypothetical protein JSW33_00115 [bacterium]|nr:MAG: hypothetical protein JSW33_00115 [bacterium]
MKKTNFFAFWSVAIIILYFSACDSSSINKSIRIKDGEKVNRAISSVNGNIRIGNNCQISGDCRTVNGVIEVGQNSIVEDLQTVNGRVEVASNATVQDDISVVNGRVYIGKGASVRGNISTINGKIMLEGAQIGRDLETYNGNIRLSDASTILGSIRIKETSGKKQHDLIIEILEKSVVNGDIIVDDKNRKVMIYKSEDSEILGRVLNADVIEK